VVIDAIRQGFAAGGCRPELRLARCTPALLCYSKATDAPQAPACGRRSNELAVECLRLRFRVRCRGSHSGFAGPGRVNVFGNTNAPLLVQKIPSYELRPAGSRSDNGARSRRGGGDQRIGATPSPDKLKNPHFDRSPQVPAAARMLGINPPTCVQVALVIIPRAGRGRGPRHRTPTAIGIGRINPSAPVQVAPVIILAAGLGIGRAHVPRHCDHSYRQRGQKPEYPKAHDASPYPARWCITSTPAYPREGIPFNHRRSKKNPPGVNRRA
jgi:hypothetical protein